MPIKTNVSVWEGEDCTITVTMTPAQSVSGWTVGFYVKRKSEGPDADLLISKTTSSGIAVSDAANGVFVITLESDDTNDEDVGAGHYHYEVVRTNSGSRTVLAYGSLHVQPQIGLDA